MAKGKKKSGFKGPVAGVAPGGKGKGKGRKPSAKAKAAYNKLIIKSYKRLHAVVKAHAPSELIK